MTLEVLSHKMMLTPIQAIALPATLDHAANVVGMNREQMIAQCEKNSALCEYLANVCRQVIQEVQHECE